jgi:hypothetical protein
MNSNEKGQDSPKSKYEGWEGSALPPWLREGHALFEQNFLQTVGL